MNLKTLIATSSIFIFSIFSFMLIAADMPSDEQITKIMMTTNTGEIQMAQLAEENAESREVKKFAKEMIKDHTKNNKKTMKLSKKEELAPELSAKSEELKKESDLNVAKLKVLKGKDFDKAYIETQIASHQKVLKDLDDSLIPSAKDKKLKKELEKTRKTVAEHLEDAKEIHAKL